MVVRAILVIFPAKGIRGMDFEKWVHTRESPKKERVATKSKEHVRESQSEVETF